MPRIGEAFYSDPEFEADNLRYLTIRSKALNGRGDISLYVPPGVEAGSDLPLVVLLHGVYGSHWNWAFMGGAHLTAQAMIDSGEISPLLVAMPSDGMWGDGSSYVPHATADYEKWIVEEVIDTLLETEPALGTGSPVYISGTSMGGYGALRLGAKYPQRFQGISGHSAVTLFEQMETVLARHGAGYNVDAAKDGSILYWLREHLDSLPPLRFDCGDTDGLIDGNRDLHRILEAEGIPHIYEEFEGGHTWDYWRLHLRDTLRFFDQIQKGEIDS